MYQIPFSALAFPNIDPIALSLGPLQVHWYGLAYVAGILFAWWWARKLVSTPSLWTKDKSPITQDQIDDFLIWAVIGIILGGRLGYVLFYDLSTYLADPLQITALWNGGMSFHGALLGSIIAIILFARKRSIKLFSLFDVISASVGIGIFLGRIANFINAELFGRPTTVSWGIVFPGGGPEPRHPSQLYEGILEGLILFLIMAFLTYGLRKLKTPGFIAGAFISWYAISRIFVEFFRLPDAHIGYLAGGWLTMGMVLSLPLLAVGLWFMQRASR
ncbi:MAG: prolipoprotein diacylglyceryl transferase [Rhizobiaceae bacterium]|nr:prolipoprotein diacylglyceryl transferase [Rhizobiaceae bacterium]